MSLNEKPDCKTCRFIEHASPKDNTVSEGYCHRYPPVLNSENHPVWTGVFYGEWCGEYRPVDAPIHTDGATDTFKNMFG